MSTPLKKDKPYIAILQSGLVKRDIEYQPTDGFADSIRQQNNVISSRGIANIVTDVAIFEKSVPVIEQARAITAVTKIQDISILMSKISILGIFNIT